MRHLGPGVLVIIGIVVAFTIGGCALSSPADKSSRIEAALQAVKKGDPNATSVSASEVGQSDAQQLFADKLFLGAESVAAFRDAWKAESKDGRVYYVNVRYKSGLPDDGRVLPVGTLVIVLNNGSEALKPIPFPY